STRHRPVISDISPDSGEVAGSGSVIALSFAALREDDHTANAIFGMNTAQTVPDFRNALRGFHAPMQNVAYAHTDGSFGFVAAGRVPIRPGGPGNIPHEGWTGANDWAGFIPFDDLPQLENPESSVIIYANNRVAARDYPHVIANDWPEGFRAQRIQDLLAQQPVHSLDSFAAIQNDVVSLGARKLHEKIKGPWYYSDGSGEAELSELFNNWDGDMSMDRVEPLIYAAFSRNFRKGLIDDELGDLANAYRGVPVNVILRILERQTSWCDNADTTEIEDCETTVYSAYFDTRYELEDGLSGSWKDWRWGDSHIANFAHP
ncbi:unnamed protein product, partial [Laminaria digitata]